ncbi:hypothetical protein DIPPA_17973 [Diplonema papillatum]|nr:hypothetical protein DIPPA_17973 [Diplonema papillatum]
MSNGDGAEHEGYQLQAADKAALSRGPDGEGKLIERLRAGTGAAAAKWKQLAAAHVDSLNESLASQTKTDDAGKPAVKRFIWHNKGPVAAHFFSLCAFTEQVAKALDFDSGAALRDLAGVLHEKHSPVPKTLLTHKKYLQKLADYTSGGAYNGRIDPLAAPKKTAAPDPKETAAPPQQQQQPDEKGSPAASAAKPKPKTRPKKAATPPPADVRPGAAAAAAGDKRKRKKEPADGAGGDPGGKRRRGDGKEGKPGGKRTAGEESPPAGPATEGSKPGAAGGKAAAPVDSLDEEHPLIELSVAMKEVERRYFSERDKQQQFDSAPQAAKAQRKCIETALKLGDEQPYFASKDMVQAGHCVARLFRVWLGRNALALLGQPEGDGSAAADGEAFAGRSRTFELTGRIATAFSRLLLHPLIRCVDMFDGEYGSRFHGWLRSLREQTPGQQTEAVAQLLAAAKAARPGASPSPVLVRRLSATPNSPASRRVAKKPAPRATADVRRELFVETQSVQQTDFAAHLVFPIEYDDN